MFLNRLVILWVPVQRQQRRGEVTDDQYRHAFLDAIRNEPDEDGPRMRYAAWLEEQDNDADQHLGAFIRLQTALTRTLAEDDPDSETVKDLKEGIEKGLGIYREDWEAEIRNALGDRCLEVIFDRGLPTGVKVAGMDGVLKLLESGLLSRPTNTVTRLVVEPGSMIPSISDVLAASPRLVKQLANLRELNLNYTHIGDDGALALADCPYLRNLRELDLRSNSISETGAVGLASPNLSNLRTLNLSGNQIGWLGAAAVASPHLTNLRELNLAFSGVEDIGVDHVAASPHLASLQKLNLSGNHIGNSGLRVLGHSPHLCNLRQLILHENIITEHSALVLGPSLANLKELDLSRNQIGWRGAGALASPHLANLRVLDLSGNPIGCYGALGMASEPHLANLRMLNLSDTNISFEGVQTLAVSPIFANLRVLDLSRNRLWDNSAQALTHFANLRVLKLSDTRIGNQGAAALAASPNLASLQELDLNRDYSIGPIGARALEESCYLTCEAKVSALRSMDLVHLALRVIRQSSSGQHPSDPTGPSRGL